MTTTFPCSGAVSADAVVAGSGPSGITTALLLARAGASVLLLLQPKLVLERSETLAPSGSQLLRRLGLWNSLSMSGTAQALEGIVSFWGSPEPQVKDFFRMGNGLGWIFDRSRFDSALLDVCLQSGVEVLKNTRIVSLSRSVDSFWDLRLSGCSGPGRVIARYLVDATGRTFTGPLRTLSGTLVVDRLIGVGASFRPAAPLRYAMIEAVDEGWFYTADLAGGAASVIYMTDANLYSCHGRDCRSYLQSQVIKAPNTESRLRGDWPSTHSVFSAATIKRKTVHGAGWTAVGDAALAFDPLSSLGIYKAIDSAERAATAILACWDRGDADFSAYEQWSQRVFLQYMEHRAYFYSMEHRWPQSVFWSRRQQS